MSHHWTAVATLDGKQRWFNLHDGHMLRKAPFVTETLEKVDGQSSAIQAYWGEFTERGNDAVREKVLTFVPLCHSRRRFAKG